MTTEQIKTAIPKAGNATKGYKTATATAMGLILRILDYVYPNALNNGTEAVLLDVATVLGTLGIGDKIGNFIKTKLKKKK